MYVQAVALHHDVSSLNCEDVTCIDVTIFLLFQEFTDFCIFINNYLVFAIIEDLVETIDEMQEADYSSSPTAMLPEVS